MAWQICSHMQTSGTILTVLQTLSERTFRFNLESDLEEPKCLDLFIFIFVCSSFVETRNSNTILLAGKGSLGYNRDQLV